MITVQTLNCMACKNFINYVLETRNCLSEEQISDLVIAALPEMDIPAKLEYDINLNWILIFENKNDYTAFRLAWL